MSVKKDLQQVERELAQINDPLAVVKSEDLRYRLEEQRDYLRAKLHDILDSDQ